MDSAAFVTTAATAVVKKNCAFTPSVSTPTTTTTAKAKAVVSRRVGAGKARMMGDSPRDDGYVIKDSPFVDDGQDDDSGDGFIGEAEMDDMLGLAMPEDLAGFEKREIQNTRSREELVDKLRDIKDRRRDIMVDRRRGIGMDNANNYLGNL